MMGRVTQPVNESSKGNIAFRFEFEGDCPYMDQPMMRSTVELL
jgi:hypothetical protein